MSKKFITLKCRSMRKLYLEDIAKVYTYEKKKTPKLPQYCNSDSDTQATPLNLMYRVFENSCLSSSS